LSDTLHTDCSVVSEEPATEAVVADSELLKRGVRQRLQKVSRITPLGRNNLV